MVSKLTKSLKCRNPKCKHDFDIHDTYDTPGGGACCNDEEIFLTSPSGQRHEVYEECECEGFIAGNVRVGSIYRTPKENEAYSALATWKIEWEKVKKVKKKADAEYHKVYNACPVPGHQHRV